METTRELKSLNFIYVDKAVDVQILFNRLIADQAAARLVLKSFIELISQVPRYLKSLTSLSDRPEARCRVIAGAEGSQ